MLHVKVFSTKKTKVQGIIWLDFPLDPLTDMPKGSA